MAWDSTRPVPWRRLVKEWLAYAAIMCAVMLAFMRDRPLAGLIGGLLASGPLYLLLGVVLAKFGYTRKTLRELRDAAQATPARASSAEPAAAGPRPKPAPTRRTGGGGRPTSTKRRR